MGLREVMLEELRDLYSAENQLVKALPKLAKAAASRKTNPKLDGVAGNFGRGTRWNTKERAGSFKAG